jgi:hypothetical protein
VVKLNRIPNSYIRLSKDEFQKRFLQMQEDSNIEKHLPKTVSTPWGEENKKKYQHTIRRW